MCGAAGICLSINYVVTEPEDKASSGCGSSIEGARESKGKQETVRRQLRRAIEQRAGFADGGENAGVCAADCEIWVRPDLSHWSGLQPLRPIRSAAAFGGARLLCSRSTGLSTPRRQFSQRMHNIVNYIVCTEYYVLCSLQVSMEDCATAPFRVPGSCAILHVSSSSSE